MAKGSENASSRTVTLFSFLAILVLITLSAGAPSEAIRSVSAVGVSAESSKPNVKAAALPTPVISDGFDFPVGTYGGYLLCPDDKGASSCYWVCRGFQDSVNNVCQKTGYGDHLGEDFNRGSLSAADDYGDPIYAVSNGEVIFAQANVPIANSNKNWGKVIIIRHVLPDGTQVESQYGHVKDMFVGVGDVVTRGQVIATIGDGDGRWGSHLHFEIRYSNNPYWGAAGPAWSTTATGWAHPSKFINSHRSLTCAFAPGDGASDGELTAFQTANAAAGGLALLGCPTTAVDTVGFTSVAGTLGYIQNFSAGQIQYLTNGSNAGQAYSVLAPLDAKWNSLGLDNTNPLGFATGNRTALLSTCFGTRRISQPFEGGSLEYHLTGNQAENVFEVHGPIYDKWAQKGFAQCPFGMPMGDVSPASPSGATGSTGFVTDFQGGSIYHISSATTAHALSGPINSLYRQMGTTASWLGFPTSDEYVSGNPRVDFEGGYITTTDGVNYEAFPTGSPQGADLSITMTDSVDPALLDENLTYNMMVTNNGPIDATGVMLTDVLPSNLTYVSATPSQGVCSGTTTVTCSLGDISSGASATLALTVKVKAVGTLSNTASVRALEYDADAVAMVPTGNNVAFEVTQSNPKTDLSITKTASPGVVVIGQNVTYTLLARNIGPSPATGIVVVDPLPASLSFVSASSTIGSCSESSGTVTCNVGNLAKSATATITIVATTSVGGTISNTASIAGNEADLITTNNVVTRTSTVLTLNTVTFTPATVAGCKDTSGKVALTAQAPAGGLLVSLSSDNPLVSVPASVTVPAGTTNVTFPVTTSPVATSEQATVTATLGPATKSGTLTLRTIGVQSLALNPNPANSGSTVTGTITLECTAAPGDIAVTVTSTNNSVAQVPGTVIVPMGSATQDFTITTGNVSTNSSSTIKATAAGVSSSVVLQVSAGNQAPVVNAGFDQTITLPADANLNGTVSDDGLPAPPAAFTSAWSMVSGPGSVVFADSNALTTTASFPVIGTYVLRLTASDSVLSASDDVTINVSSGGGASGALSVSGATPPSGVNLTTEGGADWAHWGLTNATSFNHRAGITQQISNFTKIGNGTIKRFTGNPVAYTWTNGTPTASATNTPTGVFIAGLNRGFAITVPADTTDKTVKLYVGLWQAQGKLEATLSDGSAPVVVDTSLSNSTGVSLSVFTIHFRAAAPGQQLQLRWTLMSGTGNVTLQAATLN